MDTLHIWDKAMLNLVLELNDKLQIIEKQIIQKSSELNTILLGELSIKQDNMEDYELEVDVMFFIDDLDDAIFEINENLKHKLGKKSHSFIGNDEHYFYYPKNDFSKSYKCCGLFYYLYDKSALDINTILSIDAIWWDIKPRYQYISSLKPSINKPIQWLNIVYSRDYEIYIPQAIINNDKLSIFNIKKLGKLYVLLSFEFENLRQTNINPLSDDDILKYHTPQYLNRLRSDHMLMESILKVPLPKHFSLDMIHRYVLSSIKTQCAGTIKASKLALKNGWAINLGGGFHHARKCSGGMYSPFNDYALSTIELRQIEQNLKILYIDLDAHIGDGVIEFANNTKDFFVFDMYCAYDGDNKDGFHIKQSIDNKINLIALNPYTTDELYLKLLENHLPQLFATLKPDFIFYNGGSDILKDDLFCMMDISLKAMKKRDMFVFKLAKEHKVPICMCLSGGYSNDNYKQVASSLIEVVKFISN